MRVKAVFYWVAVYNAAAGLLPATAYDPAAED